MGLSLKDIEKREREKKNNDHKMIGRLYQRSVFCPKCGGNMKYAFGETYECMTCGARELTDFGKVRDYLEKNGAKPAVDIAKNTGVSLDVISSLLRQGRIEIPDGSDVYIKCQRCGTDIRYGRYCQECSLALAKNINNSFIMSSAGEKPKKPASAGKMYTLDDRKSNKKK